MDVKMNVIDIRRDLRDVRFSILASHPQVLKSKGVDAATRHYLYPPLEFNTGGGDG